MKSTHEEIFDVVNERDEVIDRRPRSEVHRLGLLHRAVHILIFNHLGEVFLQKRSQFKDMSPGVWDSSASGHLDSGEDYDHAAVREVQEELGVDLVGTPKKVLRLEAGPDSGFEFVWVYRDEHEGPFHWPPEEIETGGWFTTEQVNRWIDERPEELSRAFIVIWKKLLTISR